MVDRRMGMKRTVLGISNKQPAGYIKHGRTDEQIFLGSDSKKQREKITVPASSEAKALDGSYCGWQPKPAVEVIIVAMKPLSEKTYVDQALKNGKGVTWLDDGRIPVKSADKKILEAKNPHTVKADNAVYGDYSMCRDVWKIPNDRFPANLIVSDDALNDGKVTTAPKTYIRHVDASGGILGKSKPVGMKMESPQDSGSFSRYFSLDAWWQKRMAELPESVQRTFPFLIVPKASKSEKNKGCESFVEREHHKYGSIRQNRGAGYVEASKLKNNHPTCKPIKLMCYLITLGSRPGDLILDPFAGSATTCIAAKMLGRRYVGIEREADYCKIGEARLRSVAVNML